MSTRDAKQALRDEISRRVSALSGDEKADASRRACRALCELPAFLEARTVLAFHPMPDEVDTAGLLAECVHGGKRVCLPLVRWKTRSMVAVEIAGADDVVFDRHGCPGPKPDGQRVPVEELDLVVVPARAFDRTGARLGRGAGFYDRFLDSVPDCPAVGLAFGCQIVDAVPTDEHDVRLGTVVTELGPVFTSAGRR